MRFAGRGKPRGSIWLTRADVAIGCHEQTLRLFGRMSALPSILSQKSKVAGLRIFAKNPKQEAIADSYNLNRASEVAYEFNVPAMRLGSFGCTP
jgi:hypothetical protein